MNEQEKETAKGFLQWTAIVLVGFAAVLLAVYFAGCKTGGPEGPTGPMVFDCSKQAVSDNWAHAYPQVMHCLTAIIADPVACLDAVPVAAKVAVDVVACIVRDVGKEAGMREGDKDVDAVTVRKAERSREYLSRRQWTFEGAQ